MITETNITQTEEVYTKTFVLTQLDFKNKIGRYPNSPNEFKLFCNSVFERLDVESKKAALFYDIIKKVENKGG